MNNEKHYTKEETFRLHLKEYYDSNKMTDAVAIHIMDIANGLARNHRFARYSNNWKEDMIGDAIEKMYRALENKSFRLDSTFNPFSYFNRIAWNAFCNRIKKEKAQHEGLDEYRDMVYTEHMSGPDSMGHVYTKPHLEEDWEDSKYD
jgi:DNA-directed RNA polymerase specialized sigma24 family protein